MKTRKEIEKLRKANLELATSIQNDSAKLESNKRQLDFLENNLEFDKIFVNEFAKKMAGWENLPENLKSIFKEFSKYCYDQYYQLKNDREKRRQSHLYKNIQTYSKIGDHTFLKYKGYFLVVKREEGSFIEEENIVTIYRIKLTKSGYKFDIDKDVLFHYEYSKRFGEEEGTIYHYGEWVKKLYEFALDIQNQREKRKIKKQYKKQLAAEKELQTNTCSINF